jgi:hypothetical protein
MIVLQISTFLIHLFNIRLQPLPLRQIFQPLPIAYEMVVFLHVRCW